jgi:Fe-coproporphyrin III synthase
MTAGQTAHLRPARRSLKRAVVFVTTFCNFRCGFCEFAADRLPRERKIHFPFERWEELLRDFRALGGREVYLTGGEPLMHPQFWEMVELAQGQGLPVHRITTNGSMRTQMGEKEMRLAREAVRAIQVSVDSPRTAEHDASRGFEGAMERLTEFIGALRAEGVQIHISNVLTRGLFRRSAELIEWAHGLGVRHVNFQPCNWEANYGDYDAVEDKERFAVPDEEMNSLDTALEEAHRMARRRGVSTNLPLLRRWVRAFFECQGTGEFFHDRLFVHFRCYVPHETVYVGSAGEIFPCTLLRHVGTLSEGRLSDLWEGAMQPVRDHLDRGQFFPECRSCYCDFPANVRKNIQRHPLRHAGKALSLLPYYMGRLRTH